MSRKGTLSRRLNVLVPIFFVDLSHLEHCMLNGSIQSLACRVLFDKTFIRTMLLGEIPLSTRCHLGEHDNRNLRPVRDWHQFGQCLET